MLGTKKFAIFSFLILLFAFLGFLDAFYLTVSHFSYDSLLCLPQSGCNLVTESVYSQILNIPLAVLGLVYYFFLLILSFFLIFKNKTIFLNYIFYISLFGFLFYLRLIYLQFFVLYAFCFYCLLSAVFNLMILFFSLICKKITKNQKIKIKITQ